jgi:predicted amidohydrolase
MGQETTEGRIRLRVLQVAYGDDEPVAARIDRVARLVADQQDADLIVLPELWAHGGFASDRWEERAETVTGPFARAMADAARASSAVVHAGSYVERVSTATPGLANTSVVFGPDGRLLGSYRKIHRFGFSGGEPLLMVPGDEVVTLDLPEGFASARLGLATCYDLRFPEMFRLLVDGGAELFVVPAAWPAARVNHWTRLGVARAIENQCFVVQCNTAGTHSGIAMGGRSQVVSPTGRILAAADESARTLSLEIDLGEVERVRAEFPVLADRRL